MNFPAMKEDGGASYRPVVQPALTQVPLKSRHYIHIRPADGHVNNARASPRFPDRISVHRR